MEDDLKKNEKWKTTSKKNGRRPQKKMEDDLNFKAVLLRLFNNKNLKNKWFWHHRDWPSVLLICSTGIWFSNWVPYNFTSAVFFSSFDKCFKFLSYLIKNWPQTWLLKLKSINWNSWAPVSTHWAHTTSNTEGITQLNTQNTKYFGNNLRTSDTKARHPITTTEYQTATKPTIFQIQCTVCYLSQS